MRIGEFIVGVSITSIMSALAQSLVPNVRVKKYLGGLLSIALAVCVLSPLTDVISGIRSTLDAPFGGDASSATADLGALYDRLEAESEQRVAQALQSSICEKFGVDANGVRAVVRVNVGENGAAVAAVNVYLSGAARAVPPQSLREYVAEAAGCECAIIYE